MTSNNTVEQNLPYAVQDYIEREHRTEADSLLADHRPVPQAVIDDITKKLTKRWRHGEEFLATITPEDAARCRKFWRARYNDPYGYRDLTDNATSEKAST